MEVRDKLIQGFFAAAFFTECNSDNPELEHLGEGDLSSEAKAKAVEICAKFQILATQAMIAAVSLAGDKDETDIGHDIWFTINGHGVGFWEAGRWAEPYAARMDAVCKSIGEFSLVKGDDGKLYLE